MGGLGNQYIFHFISFRSHNFVIFLKQDLMQTDKMSLCITDYAKWQTVICCIILHYRLWGKWYEDFKMRSIFQIFSFGYDIISNTFAYKNDVPRVRGTDFSISIKLMYLLQEMWRWTSTYWWCNPSSHCCWLLHATHPSENNQFTTQWEITHT